MPAATSSSQSASASGGGRSPPSGGGARGCHESPSIDIGVLTKEYVSTPYGVGRLIMPYEPRTDGIAVVQLGWGVAFLREDNFQRLDRYEEDQKKSKKEAESKAKAEAAQARSDNASPMRDSRKLMEMVRGGDRLMQRPLELVRELDIAPLNIPMARRRQTLALAVSSFSSLIFLAIALLIVRAQGLLFYAFLLYCTWMLLFQEYHRNGKGFKSDWFRRMRWWTWFRDYFPISLHATAPLDPKGKYIFCYHPHGILSLGAFINFGSEATGFSEKLPGIDLRILTLASNFRIPFYGIFLSMMGIADASRQSCNACLSRGPGSAILLVLGGAKESLDAHPHQDYELTLHRKGFIKVALENGADLVPVFSFGENDIWGQMDNPRGSLLRRVQERLQQKLGFAIPLVKGRGIFMRSFGLLPHRRPITTFVGPALKLPRVSKEEINDDLINEVHSQYKQALLELFNRYKATFAPQRKLIFKGEPPGARGRRASQVGTPQAPETDEPQQ